MNDFINGPIGLLHFLSASFALITGLIVLMSDKGTRLHKTLGYVYFFSMLALNISAIPITNMTGSIGVFHIFVLFSFPTVILAIYYPLFGRRKSNWLMQHFTYMYWSYIGLFAAFIAEVMVRLPSVMQVAHEVPNKRVRYFIDDSLNFIAATIAFFILGIVMFIAEIIFRKLRQQLPTNG